MEEQDKEIWERLIKVGKKVEPLHGPFKDDPINLLQDDEILTIIATLDFFGCNGQWLAQCTHDLKVPRFRVFDLACSNWLAIATNVARDEYVWKVAGLWGG